MRVRRQYGGLYTLDVLRPLFILFGFVFLLSMFVFRWFLATPIAISAIPKCFCSKSRATSDFIEKKVVETYQWDDTENLSDNNLFSNLTLVSAYFDLKMSYRKGTTGLYRNQSFYSKYLSAWSKVKNPLFFFTNHEGFYEALKEHRANLPTYRRLIPLSTVTAAHNCEEAAQAIFNQPSYPKHPPNTVHSNYSCMMHGKYELLRMSLEVSEKEGAIPFEVSPYWAWIDIGYFRQIKPADSTFSVVIPPLFNESRVAYTQVSTRNPKATADWIIKNNKLWMGGGMFVIKDNLIKGFVEDYFYYLKFFLKQGLINTDQQNLYSMYGAVDSPKRPRYDIQLYRQPWGWKADYWFYLGNLCRLASTWYEALTSS